MVGVGGTVKAGFGTVDLTFITEQLPRSCYSDFWSQLFDYIFKSHIENQSHWSLLNTPNLAQVILKSCFYTRDSNCDVYPIYPIYSDGIKRSYVGYS